MPTDYPIFGEDLFHTRPQAYPTRWRLVKNALVVKVERATYRDCAPFDGHLEAVRQDQSKVIEQHNGQERIEVYCAWFGQRPTKHFPKITLLGPYELLSSYSGIVIDDLNELQLDAANLHLK